jgi:hypothetical protein
MVLKYESNAMCAIHAAPWNEMQICCTFQKQIQNEILTAVTELKHKKNHQH